MVDRADPESAALPADSDDRRSDGSHRYLSSPEGRGDAQAETLKKHTGSVGWK